MLKKFVSIFALIAITCTIFTGCMDSREVDDEIYPVIMGLDKGVDNTTRVTVMYPNYQSGGGDKKNGGMPGGSSQGSANIENIDAPSFLEGINMLGMCISRRVSLVHTKLLVISEELARSDLGIYASGLNRFRESRPSMWVVVSKERAEDFINAVQVNVGNNISKAAELLFEESKYSNYFPQVQFKNFYKAFLSTYRQPHAAYAAINDFKSFKEGKDIENPQLKASSGLMPGDIPRKGASKTDFAGMAVFDGSKMVGALDTYETTYFLMMIGEFPAGAVTIEDKDAPGKVIVADMRNGRKPKVKVHFENGIPIIDVNVAMEADIESIWSRIHYEHYKTVPELNKMFEDSLLEGSQKLVEKTQKEFKSDVFGFGRWVVNSFSTIQEWEAYDWLSKYPDAKINIAYKVNIRRFGSMLESEQIKYSKFIKSGDKE